MTERFYKCLFRLLPLGANAFYLFGILQKSAELEPQKYGNDIRQRGEVRKSISALAVEAELTEQNVRTALKKLENNGLIKKEGTSRCTKITILDFDLYQGYPKRNNKSPNEPTNEVANKVSNEQHHIHLTSNQHGANPNITLNSDDYFIPPNEQLTSNQRATNEVANKPTNDIIKNNKENKEYKEYKKEVDVYNAHARTRTHAREGTTTPPPTLSEVRNFCFERQSIVDPVRFYNYYSKQGWDIGDWKLKVEEWENNKFSTSDRERVEKLANYRSCVSSGISENAFEIFDEAIPLKAEGE